MPPTPVTLGSLAGLSTAIPRARGPPGGVQSCAAMPEKLDQGRIPVGDDGIELELLPTLLEYDR